MYVPRLHTNLDQLEHEARPKSMMWQHHKILHINNIGQWFINSLTMTCNLSTSRYIDHIKHDTTFIFGVYEDDPYLGNFSVLFVNSHLSSSCHLRLVELVEYNNVYTMES